MSMIHQIGTYRESYGSRRITWREWTKVLKIFRYLEGVPERLFILVEQR